MLKIVNPATDEVIANVPCDDVSSIAKKIALARKAQPAWAAQPLQTRIAAIKKFREQIENRREDLALILTNEMGKPITQSLNELNGLLPRLDFFIANAERVLASETVYDDPAQKIIERIAYEPLGVIANISAWNYPYFVGSNVFIPALLLGNTVIYKPSEYATLSGLQIAEMLHEAGIPNDIFIGAIGGPEIGQELVLQKIDGVFFTGSFKTGCSIAERTAGKMIKTQLELGGKDAIYVADDVDIPSVAEQVADGCFYNTGQSCCSVERLYVHERIYTQFLEAFVMVVKKFVIGDPVEPSTYIGPLTRRQPHIKFLEDQIADAKQKGASVLIGGKKMALPGHYFSPTVLVQVSHEMKVMREETFGPLIGIMKVKNDTQAVHLINDTDYGLTAGVYTQDQARAEHLLHQLDSGTVYWNCCDRVSPRLPWSGRHHSGIGATLGIEGMRSFLKPKAYHLYHK